LYTDSMRAGSRGSSTETAVSLLRQAIALDPDFALAHAELGRAYYFSSEPAVRRQGEEEFAKALGLLDRLSGRERLWIRASAEDSRGNRTAAVEAYQSYLAQYPDDPRGWFRIGWTQMAALGQSEVATEAFRRVLAISPSDASAHVNLATCYAGSGRRREAVDEYRKAFVLDPPLLTGEFVNHEYGFTLVQLGEVDAAAEVFKKMIGEREHDKQARGHRSLALLEMYRGAYTAAISELREAVLIHHTTAAGVSELRDRLFLFQALEAKGMTRAAASELANVDRLAARMPLGPEWLKAPAKIHARSGQVGQAKALLAIMLRTKHDATAGSSTNRAASRDQSTIDLVRGEIALAERRPAEAVRLFEGAYLLESLDADILESLAVALVASGRLEDAANRYEQLIASRRLGSEGQEQWLRAHVRVGELYERLGRPDAARQSYERLLGTWKNADADLVGLKEVKARLAKLNG
jgi:tetratricopeptide (TPR) repeat protein